MAVDCYYYFFCYCDCHHPDLHLLTHSSPPLRSAYLSAHLSAFYTIGHLPAYWIDPMAGLQTSPSNSACARSEISLATQCRVAGARRYRPIQGGAADPSLARGTGRSPAWYSGAYRDVHLGSRTYDGTGVELSIREDGMKGKR